MKPRPIAPETWGKLPPEVQAYILVLENALRQFLERIAQLEQKVNELEARFNRHSRNSIPLSLHPQTRLRFRKTKGKKAYATPVANLDLQETIGNWNRLRKWIRSWSIGAEACPHCRSLLAESAGRQLPPLERHQVWELPEIQSIITEHQLVAGWGPHCSVWGKPELPAEVGRSAFGPRLQAWVAILTGRFRQCRRQICELLQELCGVSVSLGSIQSLCEETSEALAVPYREAKEAVAQVDVVHLDGTGWKEKGKRHWL